MPGTWDRSRFAPWLLRELVQVNEKTTSHLSRANSLAGQWLALTRSAISTTTKRRAQIGGSRRRRDAAAQDIVGRNWPAVVAHVRAFPRADYCALERSANEKAFARWRSNRHAQRRERALLRPASFCLRYLE